MRFLANENFPLGSVRRLRTTGHDVTAIIEDMPGASDTQVLLRAHEESRTILTFDRDYGELLYRQKLPKPDSMEGIELEGKCTVARQDRIRQRLL